MGVFLSSALPTRSINRKYSVISYQLVCDRAVLCEMKCGNLAYVDALSNSCGNERTKGKVKNNEKAGQR
jgi:hypothetical protein